MHLGVVKSLYQSYIKQLTSKSTFIWLLNNTKKNQMFLEKPIEVKLANSRRK